VDSRSEGRLPNTKGGPLYYPYFAYPQPRERFVFDTDASNVRIGGVISTYTTDRAAIAYYSKTLNRAKRNYCITRRELLAFVRTLEHFHKYLYRQRVPHAHRPPCINMAHDF
jgi:hypothetical protein